MSDLIIRPARRALRALGIDLVRYPYRTPVPEDLDDDTLKIFRRVQPFTMTSLERIHALVQSVRYVIGNDIPGAFAECGVWRGGSAMAMAMTLLDLDCRSRDIFLYDTFMGMTRPGTEDRDLRGNSADELMKNEARTVESRVWGVCDLDSARRNVESVGYPADRLRFVEGRVEETIPATAPERIAILRLDTDWYESTRHELLHLFPRVVKGGVIIIDDYGHWAGARKAVDEYFLQHGNAPLLSRVDYTGRVAVKVAR